MSYSAMLPTSYILIVLSTLVYGKIDTNPGINSTMVRQPSLMKHTKDIEDGVTTTYYKGTKGAAINRRGRSEFHVRDIERLNCTLRPVDNFLYDKLRDLLSKQVKLIELDLVFENHTVNPLTRKNNYIYHPYTWDRVAHSHGQTILSLSFNYGILSLMTLSFGVAKFPVLLEEQPYDCLFPLEEEDRTKVVLDIMLRDFEKNGTIMVQTGEAVCHQLIVSDNGYADFMDQCCYKSKTEEKIICTTEDKNIYLQLLDFLMVLVYFALLLGGPTVVTSMLEGDVLDVVNYTVKLKEPLYKTLAITSSKNENKIKRKHKVELKHLGRGGRDGYKLLRETVKHLPTDTIIPIKISEFNIRVNYMNLLTENRVPVGVLQSLFRGVFLCRLSENRAFADCCESSVLGCCRKGGQKGALWIDVCKVVGRILFIFCLPFPFYARIVIYYLFEHNEVVKRRTATENVGLYPEYDYKMLQYLTPTHTMFIGIYIMYFITGLAFAYRSTLKHKSKFQTVIQDSFSDLANQSWLNAFSMLVRNIVWPFRKFGVFGVFVGCVYWPVIVPISVVACVVYSVPLTYLTCRFYAHATGIATPNSLDTDKILPGELNQPAHMFETDVLITTVNDTSRTKNKINKIAKKFMHKDIFINVILCTICILMILSVLIMFAECIIFLLQIALFTMMGLIVNAGKVLKYGTLIFLVVIYSYDTYNNVYVKYLKLNKSLFNEVKSRVRNDLNEVTSLPSHLQDNRGFKAAEASEQGEHETTDDLNEMNSSQWIINDLILFVDHEDNPRMPKKLFEEVCEIQVAGSPGPVYKSLLEATGRFLIIVMFLVFVFIIVLSFGDVYNISNTNQMLATMAGGFLPFIFSSLLKPAAPDVELNSVSFRSKLEEILINFWQTWPMYDFPFDVEEKQEDDSDEEGSVKDDRRSDGHSQHRESKVTMTIEDTIEELGRNKRLRSALDEKVDILVVPQQVSLDIMSHLPMLGITRDENSNSSSNKGNHIV